MLDAIEQQKLADNLEMVRERIAAAALRSSRRPEDILLVAVSKTVSSDAIEAALQKKVFHFGENRVQELLEKYDILGESCSWHLIGRLQTNKVKSIIGKVTMVHSLDRLELAEELQKRACAANRTIDCLVQVNVSGEQSKAGVEPDALRSFLRKVSSFNHISVKGLMTIAPATDNPENIRWVFRSLKQIAVDIGWEKIDNISMQYLSMGMSNDFETAIEEGANIVRIGSSIFGSRN
ncbi:MAG: YggS family pyridoxal phosphate-dependent enzyme [Thermoclostridium sp.]|nr:YggS family pyridoxal phosphate-dependent enzyme [Thermoclostridium sp.]